MRNPILLFACLLVGCQAVWAGQSALEALGTSTAKEAVKSAVPTEVTEGAKAAGTAEDTVKDAPATLKGQAEDAAKSAVPAVPAEATEGAKTAKQGVNKAKTVTKGVKNPKGLADEAVESATGKAKKKAADSMLDMMH